MKVFSLIVLLICPYLLFGHGFDVLVFSKTAGFHHTSIPDGIVAIQELGVEHDFGVTITDNSAVFISQLDNHDVVVFLNTTGDILNAAQQNAFQDWYRSGKGFVGIHSACDTEKSWSWYGELLGAVFVNHPSQQIACVEFLDQVHPITNVTANPATDTVTVDPISSRIIDWKIKEEWYNFAENPRGTVHVLATLDETTYTGGAHGDDHPIMWCHPFDGGRSSYIALGHRSDTFSNQIFRDLVTNAIEWSAGELGGDSEATIESNFEKVVLSTDVSNPMSIDVAADGKIYMVERTGRVKVFDQDLGNFRTIGKLDEYSGGEYGLLGIALAPDFETTNHLYIHWSPSGVGETNTRVSRFTLDGSGNLDLSSEAVIIDYLTNRPSQTGNKGHHQAGAIRFDAFGDLYLSVGDNTQASQYSPRNTDKIGRDARKASPNTNDLRGKVIRITPDVGGGPAEHPNYRIPSGNMFPVGTALARPEIYAMGFRNPFRIMIDPITNYVYVGDVGPDAGGAGNGAEKGPRGHDEYNQVKGPGWYGWPYYIADNQPYRDTNADLWTSSTLKADLASYFMLPSFADSGASVGDPNLLPEPEPAWIWYHRDASAEFPETDFPSGVSGGRAAFAGAGYDWEPGKNFPQYYEGSIFLIEWIRSQILEVKTKPDGSILEITRFAPHIDISRPHDMVFGDDGIMYMLDYGPSFGGEGPAALFKIQYAKDVATPVAAATADVTSGDLDLTVNFDSTGTYDPDNGALVYEWDFDGDLVIDSLDPNPTHVYTNAGTYSAQLTVTDPDDLFSRVNLVIYAGNNAPQITFSEPINYSFFDWGDLVAYEVSVFDIEDGTTSDGGITPADVLLEVSLGHGDHQHTDYQYNQLSGSVLIPRDESHRFDEDLAYVFDAFYSDDGAPSVGPISVTAKAVVQPKVMMANTFDGASGVSTAATVDPVGGQIDIVQIDSGDYIVFNDLNLGNIQAIRARAAGITGGNILVKQGSSTGTTVATITIPEGDGDMYADYSAPLSGVSAGQRDLYFVFAGTGANVNLLKLNWIGFRGEGATLIPNRPTVSGLEQLDTSTLRISFDQAMDFATMADLKNYTINSGSITSVSPWPDQTGADLSLSGLLDSNYYTIELKDIEDLAGDLIAPETSFTFLYQSATQSVFQFGLNAGGSNFTDSEGNLYIDDGGTFIGTNASLLVDIQNPNGSRIESSVSDFQLADTNILNDTPINKVTIDEPSDLPLNSIGLSGVTMTLMNTDGIFNTNKGAWDGTPILDGYVHSGAMIANSSHPVLTLNGLSDVPTNSVMTVTLWGVGDTTDSDGIFEVVYNGSVVDTKITDYDGSLADTRVQFTINKLAGVDQITVNWGRFGATTTGLNGFSLTAPVDAQYLINDPNQSATSDAISGTIDDVLYQSNRWKVQNFGYQIPVQNGSYEVLLRFAETVHTDANLRQFNVEIEGSAAAFASELDLFSEVGHDAAYDLRVEGVEVNDHTLNIDFIKGANDNPLISAIGVFKETSIGESIPNPSFASYLASNPDSNYNSKSDFDVDGLESLLEYALGGNDAVSDIFRLPDLIADEVGDFLLVFNRPVGLPDLMYTIEASDDFDETSWRQINPSLVIGNEINGFEQVRMEGLRAAAASVGLLDPQRCFFRLKITLQSPKP